MTHTELILVRHGETEWNAQSMLQGHLDSPLTVKGIEQAHILGRRIADMHPDHIYSSDLGRAHDTAKIIAGYCQKSIHVEEELREKNLGIFQGHSWKIIQEKFPREYEEFSQIDPDYVIPEGESYTQFVQRITKTLQQIASRHPCEKILVVTHGGIISALIRHILSIPLSAPP